MSNSVDIEYYDQSKLHPSQASVGYSVHSRKEKEEGACAKGCIGGLMLVISFFLIIITFPFSLFFCIRIVQEYERAVLFRLGRVRRNGTVGPGMFFIVPCLDQIMVMDLRTVSFDVPPQEILTRDSVTVAVDAVVYYRIYAPMDATCNVEDYAKSTKLLASTTLRTILGTKSLSEILSDRESISKAFLRSCLIV